MPVILLTALDDPASRAQGIDAGADEVLAKPVHPFELRLRVRAMLRIQPPGERAARGQPAAAAAGAHRRAHRRAQPARAALGAAARVPPRRALRRRAVADGLRRRSLQVGQRHVRPRHRRQVLRAVAHALKARRCARSTSSAAPAAKSSWCWRRRRRSRDALMVAERLRAQVAERTVTTPHGGEIARHGQLRHRHARRRARAATPDELLALRRRRALSRQGARPRSHRGGRARAEHGRELRRPGADHASRCRQRRSSGDARDYSAAFRLSDRAESTQCWSALGELPDRARAPDVGDRDQDAAQVLVVDALGAARGRRALATDRAIVTRRLLHR